MGRKSSVVIVVLWTACLVDSAWDALTSRIDPPLLDLSYPFDVIALVLPLVFFPLMAACARRGDGVRATALGRWIDAKLGAGSCDDFLRRLRPLVLFAVGASVAGSILIVRVAMGHAPASCSLEAAWYLSCAAGLGMAQFIASRRRVWCC